MILSKMESHFSEPGGLSIVSHQLFCLFLNFLLGSFDEIMAEITQTFLFTTCLSPLIFQGFHVFICQRKITLPALTTS